MRLLIIPNPYCIYESHNKIEILLMLLIMHDNNRNFNYLI